ncbi:putative Lecithin cholesterol acyltransferase [Trypanosoma vivax]|uniref:Phospholipid:diacylglycerol acyltransferase-like protein, putative n=1 Tax=Trypanosoma vivax (strain Y486) TaxID=1055687 RepID=F9WTZ4_TRYVY|nr:putative phospholipid:diacylglycerol acyltransferase-like protein [Trypanosoma vivax]KAH8604907.1 putative Lecithin cholesterol acyltransferase [Trypanosoma vivax]CCD21040.1 phospholipid:diacylglycerol acyltransferase-like protein, putative [Trypanosoma vivax Y486]|eukprot:CCD21040.1 phospholipid:diacylglycerol acyltransferase-like protein, putative [Trypanosoma vivax Y486]
MRNGVEVKGGWLRRRGRGREDEMTRDGSRRENADNNINRSDSVSEGIAGRCVSCTGERFTLCVLLLKRPWELLIANLFIRRRVMLVMLVVAILLGCSNQWVDVSSLKASFLVAETDRPGLTFLQNYTIKRRHPVMIVPGFISTALEVWQDDIPCMRYQPRGFNFRERVFGPRLLFLLATDPTCFMQLISLDKKTGHDPEGVKLRSDMGFGAADFFVLGYWVWAKIFINLADIGYDPQSMGILGYDWRLAPHEIHRRDGYYDHLRNYLLYLYHRNNERVVLISHSYGSIIVADFLYWMEKQEPGWMNKYVAHWINVAGTMMGVAKTVSALLSGDAKDTLTLPGPARQLLETYLSRDLRTETFRTWSCQVAMFPRDCNGVFQDIITLQNGTRLPPAKTLQFIAQRLRESGHTALEREAQRVLNDTKILPSLPWAPNSTVFCLYGVGHDTEVGYVLGSDEEVNNTYDEEGRVTNGVIIGDGDGTVPLMSLAYMCRGQEGWKKNVGRVVTREHKNNLMPSMNLRGGPTSGQHVDILGNYELIETVLKIVTGNAEGGKLGDRIYSDVDKHLATAGPCRDPASNETRR